MFVSVVTRMAGSMSWSLGLISITTKAPLSSRFQVFPPEHSSTTKEPIGRSPDIISGSNIMSIYKVSTLKQPLYGKEIIWERTLYDLLYEYLVRLVKGNADSSVES